MRAPILTFVYWIDGLTALMVVCMSKPHSLHDRVEYCARLLVDRGAQVNVHDRYRMTPLLYACQSCHIGVVEYLISVKANVNAQDVRGWSVSKLLYLGTT